jgi:hypothetical protein
MSAEALGWVYKYSPYSGAAFSVHCAIADSANDQNHMELWMALGKLGRKARVGRQACSGVVQQMVTDGFLEVVERSAGGRHRPSRYRFLMPPGTALFFDYTYREGVPTETVVSGDSRGVETVASASETVASGAETVAHGDTRRTQGNPKNLPVLRVCCGENFTSLELYQDHLETCIEANDWTPAAKLKLL